MSNLFKIITSSDVRYQTTKESFAVILKPVPYITQASSVSITPPRPRTTYPLIGGGVFLGIPPAPPAEVTALPPIQSEIPHLLDKAIPRGNITLPWYPTVPSGVTVLPNVSGELPTLRVLKPVPSGDIILPRSPSIPSGQVALPYSYSEIPNPILAGRPDGDVVFLWTPAVPSGQVSLPYSYSETPNPIITGRPEGDITFLWSPSLPSGPTALPSIYSELMGKARKAKVEGYVSAPVSLPLDITQETSAWEQLVKSELYLTSVGGLDTRLRTLPQDAFYSATLQEIATWLPAFYYLNQSFRSLPRMQVYPSGTEVQDAWVFSGVPPYIPLDPTLWGGIEQLFRSMRSTGETLLDIRLRTSPIDAFFFPLAEQVANRAGAISQLVSSFRSPRLPYDANNPSEYPFDTRLRTTVQDAFLSYVYQQIASWYPTLEELSHSFRSPESLGLDTRYRTSLMDAYYQFVFSQIAGWMPSIEELRSSYRSLPPNMKWPKEYQQPVYQATLPTPFDPTLWGSVEQLFRSYRSLPSFGKGPFEFTEQVFQATLPPPVVFDPVWMVTINELMNSLRSGKIRPDPRSVLQFLYNVYSYYVPLQLLPPPITPPTAIKTFSLHREGWLIQNFTKSQGGDVETTERR